MFYKKGKMKTQNRRYFQTLIDYFSIDFSLSVLSNYRSASNAFLLFVDIKLREMSIGGQCPN